MTPHGLALLGEVIGTITPFNMGVFSSLRNSFFGPELFIDSVVGLILQVAVVFC